MLRAAFRSIHTKELEDQESSPSSSRELQVDDEFKDASHEFSMAFSKENDQEESSVHLMDNAGTNSSTGNEKMEHETLNEPVVKADIFGGDPATIEEEEKVGFPYSERDIYEMQLVQLQEQLVATMIQAQEKNEQLEALGALDLEKLVKDLEEEREKNKDLNEKLKRLKQKNNNTKLYRKNASRLDPRSGGNQHSWHESDSGVEGSHSSQNGEEWVDLGQEFIDNDGAQEPKSPSPGDTSSHPGSAATSESSAPGGRKDKPDGTKEVCKPSKFEDIKKRMTEMVVDRLLDFVNDELGSTVIADDDGDSLTVKTLKENINRFTNGIRPITNFIKSVNSIVSWSSTTASFLAFVVYMYASRHGYLVSFLLLIMIWQLFINYLYARGIATQLGFGKKVKEEVSTDDKSWSDKFQLVLQVAKKVQNLLGKMADSLEKIKNLLLWKHPATKKLFTNLCMAFAASVVFEGTTLFMFIALALGVKWFIFGPIYRRFPKVKKRYSNVARIWEELPVDADIAAMEAAGNETGSSCDQFNSSTTSLTLREAVDVPTVHSSSHSSSHIALHSLFGFCERHKIPSTESPLPSWEEGRRCTLMNKDKPLTNMKHGKLFLTESYLCFERTKYGHSKNIAIKLDCILRLRKYKPIGIIPGTGMAIEVDVKGVDKPYIFGALMGRDEVYESIICTARAANLPWATNG